MLKKLLPPACLILAGLGTVMQSRAQIFYMPAEPAGPKILLAIPDQSVVSYWNILNGMPVFTIPAINTLLSTHGAVYCRQLYPQSRFLHKQREYRISCSDTNLVHQLHAAYPQYFPEGSVYKEPMPLAYYPNDWDKGHGNHGYLAYIKAPQAWEISKGSPNVIIGINDTKIDPTHPELLHKLVMVGDNTSYTGNQWDHGTVVAGFAAGHTDNNIGFASVGFNCKMDFEYWGDGRMLLQSNRGAKIINGSWGWQAQSNPMSSTSTSITFSEIYENGSFVCMGAGNGPGSGIPPWYYVYPASYDHVFSVSGLGWEKPYGQGHTAFVEGLHEIITGDTSFTHNHNAKVDLMAPSTRLGGLRLSASDPNIKYTDMNSLIAGTSAASPMVAGTAGLMLSLRNCLTPYQLEYHLKKSAQTDVLSLSENIKYAGRLGAGALDVEKAVKSVQPANICNDAGTQTMYIKGVELTGICRPASASNGHKPKLKPVIENGKPPYTYHWQRINDGASNGNQTTLDAYNIAEPSILTSYGGHKAVYRVWVYDNSPVQKVASKHIEIQLTDNASYDLASRDSYMDMLDEPNTMQIVDPREWSIWHSPDIWVRHKNDNGLVHQQPEYFDSKPNFIHVRVRNVGCMPAPENAGRVKVYWTKASTGENWQYDWDGTTQVASSGGGVIPGGGEVASSPKTTPILQPGESTILKYEWYPTRPEYFYGSPNNVEVCVLSRIEHDGQPNNGMTIPEITNTNIAPNVWNNNNIATYNMFVKNLYPGNEAPFSILDVSNAESFAGEFTIQFINDRLIQRHHAGDFSAIGHIRLHLGALYERWMETGVDMESINGRLEPETRSVLLNGVDLFSMHNIRLEPKERFPVKIEFIVDNPDALTGNSFLFHLRQFTKEDSVKVYGNVSIQVNTHTERDLISGSIQGLDTVQLSGNFVIYPNPAQSQINIRNNYNDEDTRLNIFDVTGRVVIKESFYFEKMFNKTIDIAKLAPGVYIILIETQSGLKEQYKFVKQ